MEVSLSDHKLVGRVGSREGRDEKRSGGTGTEGGREGDIMTKNAKQSTSLRHKMHTVSVAVDIYWHSQYMSSVIYMPNTNSTFYVQNNTDVARYLMPRGMYSRFKIRKQCN